MQTNSKALSRLKVAQRFLSIFGIFVICMGGVTASSDAEMLLGTIHFNSPAGFTQPWTTVQFSLSDSGATLFNTSPYYAPGQSGTVSLTSGVPFTFFSYYLTDGDNGAVRLTESFKNGSTSLGGLFQDSIESLSIAKTAYGNHYSSLPDFSGYAISKIEMTAASITKTYLSPNYVASYNTNVNIYGDLIPVPEPSQVAASLAAMAGLGVVVLRKRSTSKQAI